MKIPLLVIAAIFATTAFPTLLRAIVNTIPGTASYLFSIAYIILLFCLIIRPIALHIKATFP